MAKIIVLPLEAIPHKLRLAVALIRHADGFAVTPCERPDGAELTIFGEQVKYEGLLFRFYEFASGMYAQTVNVQDNWRVQWWRVDSTVHIQKVTQPGDSHGNEVAAEES